MYIDYNETPSRCILVVHENAIDVPPGRAGFSTTIAQESVFEESDSKEQKSHPTASAPSGVSKNAGAPKYTRISRMVRNENGVSDIRSTGSFGKPEYNNMLQTLQSKTLGTPTGPVI
jgi:hypothetical protein